MLKDDAVLGGSWVECVLCSFPWHHIFLSFSHRLLLLPVSRLDVSQLSFNSGENTKLLVDCGIQIQLFFESMKKNNNKKKLKERRYKVHANTHTHTTHSRSILSNSYVCHNVYAFPPKDERTVTVRALTFKRKAPTSRKWFCILLEVFEYLF